MNKLIPSFLALLALAGCSAPKSPEVNPVQEKPQQEKNVLISEAGLFRLQFEYVSPSTTEFLPGAENQVRYHITLADRSELRPEYRVEFSYDMPGMPGMGGPWSPKTKQLADGKIEVTYEIVHGGFSEDAKWVFTYKLFNGQKLVDTLTRGLWVKE